MFYVAVQETPCVGYPVRDGVMPCSVYSFETEDSAKKFAEEEYGEIFTEYPSVDILAKYGWYN